LYDTEGKPTMSEVKLEKEDEIEIDNVGPQLPESEIVEAIRYMKNIKAGGVNRVLLEFLKSCRREM
jgi:hypothetical protein